MRYQSSFQLFNIFFAFQVKINIFFTKMAKNPIFLEFIFCYLLISLMGHHNAPKKCYGVKSRGVVKVDFRRSGKFQQKHFQENVNFSETTWNFQKRFEDSRVNLLNNTFLRLLEHHAAHMYRYMGLNIPNFLVFFEGFFDLKKCFMSKRHKL